MPSKSEQVMQALFAALRAGLPLDVALGRNETLPTRIPSAGLVILRDGDPGEPEVLLSPLSYVYEHEAEVDVVVDAASAERDARFDAIKVAIGAALAVDRTLGGLCDYVTGLAPVPVDVAVEGGGALKAATVGVLLTYSTGDPLA